MPLPMVHLTVAVQAHALADRALTPEFMLGSLAPDAIHMRANTSREDKNRVHLHLTGANEADFLERIRLLLEGSCTGQDGPDPFVQGYAAHLLTDYWWLQAFAQPFAEQLPPGTSPEERRAWYYRETDQVDFNLYHCVPWRKTIWGLLAAANAPDFPPYLAAGEIDHWRQRILDWFDKLKQEPGIVPQIITERLVMDFIASTAPRIRAVLLG